MHGSAHKLISGLAQHVDLRLADPTNAVALGQIAPTPAS